MLVAYYRGMGIRINTRMVPRVFYDNSFEVETRPVPQNNTQALEPIQPQVEESEYFDAEYTEIPEEGIYERNSYDPTNPNESGVVRGLREDQALTLLEGCQANYRQALFIEDVKPYRVDAIDECLPMDAPAKFRKMMMG